MSKRIDRKDRVQTATPEGATGAETISAFWYLSNYRDQVRLPLLKTAKPPAVWLLG